MPGARDVGYIPSQLRSLNIRASCYLFEDFSGGAISSGLTALDVSPTGASTAAGVSAAGGQLDLTVTNNNETKAAGLYQNDVLTWPIGWGIVWACRFRVRTMPAAAGSILLLGLATARNATADNVAENIWFRADANANLLVEFDDGTTDDDDNDTGLDLVVDQYVTLVIDTRQRSRLAFYAAVDISDELTRVLPQTQFNYATAATGLFQSLIEVQATDAAQPRINVDWVGIWAERAADAQSTLYPAVTL